MYLKRILAVVLAVAASGTVTVTALATYDSSKFEAKATKAAWSEKRHDPFDKLLEDGVVSQDTYDKMKAYFVDNAPQRVERTERRNVLDELLKAEIITQAEYDALKAAMPTPEKPNAERPKLGEKSALPNKPQFVNPFDKFVEDGVISENTATAIREYLKSNMPEKPQIKEPQINERTDIFSKMLEDGVITQAEYDSIKASMPERPARTKHGGNNQQTSDN